MRRFLTATVMAITVVFVVMFGLYLYECRVDGESWARSLIDALVVGGYVAGLGGLSGIAVGAALFRLLKRFLPVRWYTRIPCALLSCQLSFFPVMLMLEVGVIRIDDMAAAVPFLGTSMITGTVFGCGAGQSARKPGE